MLKFYFFAFLLIAGRGAYSQASAGPKKAAGKSLATGTWRASLLRAEGHPIVFNFELAYEKEQPVIYILNASERLEVRNIRRKGDSVWIDLPFFESAFFLQLQKDGTLKGDWRKGTTKDISVMPFVAVPHQQDRFSAGAAPVAQLSGKWAMTILRPDGSARPAIAQFEQKGAKLTGTILAPSGDYRYLDGIVRGDSLFLSTFDGSHAYVFTARIHSTDSIDGGRFYAGPTHLEKFSASRNEQAVLPLDGIGVYLKPDAPRLNFRFPDLEGRMVGITDERFRNKVVVIQLMGSWCPNCMDETNFLSAYYKKHKARGLEVVSLAYEYSTDSSRYMKSLRKFQQRFQVTYPMLITGVTSSDSLRTEKTLPQLTPIKVFPSTVFVGKDGQIKKVHSGFFGPATGEAYTNYVAEFEATINQLLAE
ncbi:TlpA disulfide reductase family protein [Flavihumibacter sp. CACIAM 22H1]|uniref:peroxiredoxin family protein n=1 Tax=Flavihumibacter sp. CACIAM 22H1 TaxID=1812911 RepID=UPI000AD4C546|nr:TlpA disulfide reductase family protein [Flavihumibacter sp. CACIAM 22H1]